MSSKFPSDEILADYASGALPPGLSLLVASHLTFSPDSRERVAGLEAVGGAMLARETPQAPPPPIDAVLGCLDAAAPEASAPPRANGPSRSRAPVFPAPLRAVLGDDPEALAWKFRLPGVAECDVPGFDGEDVSLLRARPGAPLLSHTHSGLEATLVLTGLMEDRGRVLGRGDVALATDEDDHRPRIVGDEVCICLVVLSGGLRFTGPFSRALNIFAE